MEPYIEGSNALRTLAKNDFENILLKFMNTVVFGNTVVCMIPTQKTEIAYDKPPYEGYSIAE
jgi:hypothetical protein